MASMMAYLRARVLVLVLVVSLAGGAGAVLEAGARVVVASCRNTTDCTDELQAALDTCAAVVRVPALPSGRSWVVRPIHARCSGQTIDFAPAAVLQVGPLCSAPPLLQPTASVQPERTARC